MQCRKLKGAACEVVPRLVAQEIGVAADSELIDGLRRKLRNCPAGVATVSFKRPKGRPACWFAVEWQQVGKRWTWVATEGPVPQPDTEPAYISVARLDRRIHRSREYAYHCALRRLAAKRLGQSVVWAAFTGGVLECSTEDGTRVIFTRDGVLRLGPLPEGTRLTTAVMHLLLAAFGQEVADAISNGRLPDFVWQRLSERKEATAECKTAAN